MPLTYHLAYLLAYLGAPVADASNILTDFYGSVADWLSQKAVCRKLGGKGTNVRFTKIQRGGKHKKSPRTLPCTMLI